MSTFTQTALGKYLGVWRYEQGTVVKYWRVLPSGYGEFEIRWGRTLAEFDAKKSPNKIVINGSEECYKRILSKARGGYEFQSYLADIIWTPKCYDEFNTISEVLVAEQTESRKRKPRKRKLSLLDWMNGLEEHRENEQI